MTPKEAEVLTEKQVGDSLIEIASAVKRGEEWGTASCRVHVSHEALRGRCEKAEDLCADAMAHMILEHEGRSKAEAERDVLRDVMRRVLDVPARVDGWRLGCLRDLLPADLRAEAEALAEKAAAERDTIRAKLRTAVAALRDISVVNRDPDLADARLLWCVEQAEDALAEIGAS